MVPLNEFMDRLELLVLGMLGVTILAFSITAYVACKYIDTKRNNDE